MKRLDLPGSPPWHVVLEGEWELDQYFQIPERFKTWWKTALAYDFESISYVWNLIQWVRRDTIEAALTMPRGLPPAEPPPSQAKLELLSRFWMGLWTGSDRFFQQLIDINRRPYIMDHGEMIEYKPCNIVGFIYLDLVRKCPQGEVVTFQILETVTRQWFKDHKVFYRSRKKDEAGRHKITEMRLTFPKDWRKLLRKLGLDQLPGTPRRGRPTKKV